MALVLVLGALVFLPAVRSPYLLDDYLHAAMVDGRFVSPRGPFDLYDFVSDDDRAAMRERGLLPWWAHPRLRIRFLRPLSSALRYVELKMLAGRPLPMHLHSLAWWAAAVLSVRALLRRLLAPRAALLGTAIFALGPWHVLPIAWLANREVLVSLTFGALALAAHSRWRERGRLGDGAIAAGLFGLAFLAGEYALCLGGYVLAFELFGARERAARRALGLLPFAAPALAYLTARAAMGYGTSASAFYSDPLREPLAFLATAPARLLTLLAEGWLTVGTDAWGTSLPRWIQAALVLAGGALVVVPLRRTWRAQGEQRRRALSWLLGGSLASLVPVLAVVPAPRLLGIAAIGMAATVGALLDHAWFPASPSLRRGAAELTTQVATVLGFLHLVHGPAASWLAARDLRRSSLGYAATSQALRARLPDVGRAEVSVVRGGAGMYFEPFALDPGGVLPARWRILSHAWHVLALRRGERSLELVAPPGGGLYPVGPANLFRTAAAPLHAGEVIELPGMRVEVLRVGAGGAERARFTFDRPLEEAPLAWVEEGAAGFVDVELPSDGFGVPFGP